MSSLFLLLPAVSGVELHYFMAASLLSEAKSRRIAGRGYFQLQCIWHQFKVIMMC